MLRWLRLRAGPLVADLVDTTFFWGRAEGLKIRDGSEDRDNGKSFVPAATYDEVEPAPLPPMAPDGGPVPTGIGFPAGPPEATPDNSPCLRGPCRHYWKLVTTFPSGNPADTWKALGRVEPRQHHHLCLVHDGLETDLTDDCVFECSRWDPKPPTDELLQRRESYFNAHPEHRPGAQADIDDDLPSVDELGDDPDDTDDEPVEEPDGPDRTES